MAVSVPKVFAALSRRAQALVLFHREYPFSWQSQKFTPTVVKANPGAFPRHSRTIQETIEIARDVAKS